MDQEVGAAVPGQRETHYRWRDKNNGTLGLANRFSLRYWG